MPSYRLSSVDDLPRANTALAQELATAVGGRADNLADALRRARRHLPKKLVREADFLIEAEGALDHPKLSRQVDLPRAERALRRLSHRADRIDLKTERELRWLGTLTGLMINLALVVAAVIALLMWRGII